MKKIILTLLMVLACTSVNAITLFPHFVDVAGDYDDKPTEKFQQLNISVNHSRVSPYFYKKIKDADDFLRDTLPFSNYTIGREEKKLDDGTIIITYVSSLEADGLNKDKWSTLYLIQTPGEPLHVGIAEDAI